MAHINYRRVALWAYPIVILCLSLGFVSYWYKRNQALQAENQALKEKVRRTDGLIVRFLSNTRHYSYDFFGMTYVGYAPEYIDQYILLYGAYEKEELFFLRDVAQNLHDDHLVFFDIGAFTGQHSLFMSRYAKVVHSFEPYPTAAARFRRNVEINGIKNINLWPIGLGKEAGTLPFHVPPHFNPGIGSLMPDWYKGKKDEKITVEVKRGDDLPAQVLSDVDLIKLDTEGYEKNIVIGLSDTLRKKRPIIVMELNVGGGEKWATEADIYSHLPPNYKLFLIKELPPEGEGRYQLEKLGNYFSIPRVTPHIPTPENVVLFPAEKEDKIPLRNIN